MSEFLQKGSKKGYLHSLSKVDEPYFFSVLHNRQNRYNIGIPSIHNARHIQYNINPLKPNIQLYFDKTTPNVNIGFVIKQELNMDFGDVFFHPRAKITIDKRDQKQRTYQKNLVNELSYHINVDTQEYNQFIMYPLVKESGIILAYEIENENINKITCNSLFFILSLT